MPINGTGTFASMLAVALPPMRGCMMTIELPRMIGKSANMPEANEPMRELAPVTTETTKATVKARNGISSGVRTKETGPVLPRKRLLSGMVTA
jgi:hypothetical protein